MRTHTMVVEVRDLKLDPLCALALLKTGQFIGKMYARLSCVTAMALLSVVHGFAPRVAARSSSMAPRHSAMRALRGGRLATKMTATATGQNKMSNPEEFLGGIDVRLVTRAARLCPPPPTSTLSTHARVTTHQDPRLTRSICLRTTRRCSSSIATASSGRCAVGRVWRGAVWANARRRPAAMHSAPGSPSPAAPPTCPPLVVCPAHTPATWQLRQAFAGSLQPPRVCARERRDHTAMPTRFLIDF